MSDIEQARIFVSYASEDDEFAQTLVAALRNANMDPFMFLEDNIPAGLDYRIVLQEMLNGADFIVLLWSDNAKKSSWINDEIVFAKQRRKMILPVLLDGAKELPSALKHTQAIRAYADKLGWELQVTEHIRAHILLQLRLVEIALTEVERMGGGQPQESHISPLSKKPEIDLPGTSKPSIARSVVSDVVTIPNALKVGAGLAVLLAGIFGGSGGKNTKRS
jgi:hypothetical protein